MELHKKTLDRSAKIGVWKVIDAAGAKPFGFMPFYPGAGLGGHCIPVDPLSLFRNLKLFNYNARFIELASEVNTHMPEYVATKIARVLNRSRKSVNGAKILVLGVSYKPNISDIRESPSLDIIRLLQQEGAEVTYSDPFSPTLPIDDGSLQSADVTAETLKRFDCAVIVTDHSTFDCDLIVREAAVVVDCRNAIGNRRPTW